MPPSALEIIAAIEHPPVIAKILSHLGLSAWAPPRPQSCRSLLLGMIKRLMKFLTRKGFLIEEQGMGYLADYRSGYSARAAPEPTLPLSPR